MLLFSPLTIAAAAVVLIAVQVIRVFTSPLRAVPGPWASRSTGVYLRWKELCAERTSYIHSLHLQYGPVVRIAPDEVSFTSWPALKEIYCSGGSGFDKTNFYDMFKIYGRRTMFTTLNKTDHAKRKRILADRYANTNIMRNASLDGIKERSRKFVQRCGTESPADIFVTLHAYACDCATHHLFHPYGTNCLEKQEEEDMMHQVAADDSLQNRLISHWAPALYNIVSPLLSLVAKPREIPLADNYVLGTSERKDMAQFTLLSRLEEKSSELDHIAKASECLDHMAAGIDTTGDGLCFLMWELSQPRSIRIQQRLQAEADQYPDLSFDQLPYLDAVVCEGLRCFPPIPMSLPRCVPEGGRTIDGYWIPEKTTVSCQAFSVHRINEDVFPDPETFNPDRWLAEDGDTARRRLLFAFANGGRGCVGKHLAMAEMKTLLRDVYSRYSTVADEATTEESMAMSDQLISSRPVGGECLLRFLSRDHETMKA